MMSCTRTRTRAHTRLLLAGVLLAVTSMAPRPSHAQATPERRTGAVIPERLQPATRAAIERLADSLEAERLPGYAVRDKAAEGALKGADDARILTAVRSLAARLRESRSLLGASAADDELVASAGALYSGVPAQGIARLAASQRQRMTRGNASAANSLSVPLTVLAELTSARVPSDVALASVDALLSRGARDVDFGAFRLAVERDIRSGRAPRDAVSTGMQSTLRAIGRPPG
ncbi:MAG: hypothetical protein V4617_01385 [Gemmatimonadota bacterium]